MGIEILVILLLIVLNGALATAEIAIISARKTRLQKWANRGDQGARRALELASSPNRFLSSAQIGITLIGILAGAYGGATLAEQLRLRFEGVTWLARYAEAAAIGIVVIGTTYLSLVLGELVPKRLALHHPERVASLLARPMGWLARITFPAVHLLSASTDMVLRLLRIRPSTELPVSEEEVRIMVKQGVQVGVFERAEQEMVENVFRLGDQRVQALMTPRHEIVWIDTNASLEEAQQIIETGGFSRYPVGEENVDHIVGFVRAKDLLVRCLAHQPFDLRAVLRRPLFVPESTRALKVMEMFKQSGVHIAVVLDEYGVTEGIVTHNDLLEAIVGYIPTVGQPADAQIIRREDGSWLLDGLLPTNELQDLLGLEKLPPEHAMYHTLAGFVMTHFGRIPAASDHFDWGGWRFEVVDMDGHRIDKVLVMRAKATERA